MPTYPLTPLQKTMLFSSVTNPFAGLNIEQVVLHIPHVIKADRLREAWRRTLERHDILRTSFHWPGGREPYQQVEDQADMSLQILDWKTHPSETIELEWEILLDEDRTSGFDTQQAPLMRCRLVRFTECEDRLLWTFHHILLDGRSISLVLEDVLSFYEELENGETKERSPSKPFSEFVEWLNRLDERPAAHYWKNLLGDFEAPQPLQLTEGDHREGISSKPYELVEIWLDDTEAHELEWRAKEQDITLNTWVQAAWALVLSRYLDHSDIVFGAVRACRHWGGAAQKDRVGLFINNLPVRIRILDDQPVGDFLQALRQQHLEIRDYEFSAIDKIREWAGLPRDTPLLESSVMFEQGSFGGNLHRALPQWSGVRVDIHERAGLPFMLGATRDQGLRLELEYDTHRCNASMAERMLHHLRQALFALSESPHRSLGEISILKPEEYQRLVYDWNRIPNDYRLDQCAHRLIEDQVNLRPDAIAVEAGDIRLRYAELNTRSNRLAHRLKRMGIGREDWVGISVQRSPWMIVGILGILKAGAAYVPIDPEYPEQRKEFIIQDAELKVVICDRTSLESLPACKAQVIIIDLEWEDIENESDSNVEDKPSPDDAAYMIYTSGSTGIPKGVVNLHRGLVNEILNVAQIFGIDSSDRILQFSTINFDAAIEEIFTALTTGATLVLRPKEMLTTRQIFHQGVEDLRITMLDLPTAFWNQWVNYMEQENPSVPSNLRVVVVGGEKVAANVYEAWQQVSQGRVRWVNTYGPTETAIVSHYFVSPDTPECRIPLKDVPIGRVLANDCAYVLDSKRRPVPQGVVGELYIGGAGVARGYWKRPDLTDQAFMNDPFVRSDPIQSTHARMYRTGDRVRYREDGELDYVGRTDFQIKLRGFRVEPGEIEQALGEHPEVAETLVLAHKTNRNTLSLVAYVVVGKVSLTASDLREFLRDRLPDYMIPQAFVFLEAFPLTPNGKVDRKALPKPTFDDLEDESYIAATNPLEEKLTAIFARVLRVERIGVMGNFFDHGGDSLMTIELIEEAMKAGIELDPQTLFQYPAIRPLAEYLSASSGNVAKVHSPLVPMNAQGNRPPIYLIHATPGDVMGYGNLVHHLGADQPCYGFTSRGLLEVDQCHRTIEEMAAYYIEHLLAFDPQGPYILSGWCYGGTVAYEMARQLREAGCDVALVILIECLASPPPGKWGTIRHRLRRLTSFLRMPLNGRVTYLKNKIHHRLAPQFDRLEENIALTESPASLANRLSVYRENMKAFWRYRCAPYPEPLDVILSNEPTYDSIYDPQGGWPLIAPRARYHYFSGRHDNILKEPAVGPLALRIRRIIDERFRLES